MLIKINQAFIPNIEPAEKRKAIEKALERKEIVLEAYKLMKHDYANMKKRVKNAEKRLMTLVRQAGEQEFTCKWVMREIESIEKKYIVIDQDIKRCKQAMKAYETALSNYYFNWYPPFGTYDNALNRVLGFLSSVEGFIRQARDAMRIAERYFKNINSSFEAYAKLTAARKQGEQRLRAKELQAAKDAEAGKQE